MTAEAAGVPAEKVVLRPQPGPQEDFLSSPADIVVYGGAAGGGKSWALLFEPLRHVTTNPEFYTVFFRRNLTHIRNPGGLWDEAMKMYPQTDGVPIGGNVLEWKWDGGGKIKMGHLDHETTVLDWQGSQIPLIIFDELTHFSESQFFYLLSRNRSMCGVKPYIRASTNPDADSWVAKFIAWWIDQDTGYAIPERSGVVRWFIRVGDAVYWGDSREELLKAHGKADLTDDHEEQVRPKSFTFIAAKLSDNKALMKADPDYLANLMALPLVERERLLGGNWKVRPAAGLYFKRTDVTITRTWPTDVVKWVRGWDLAATEVTAENKDPDFTVGVLMGRRENGKYFIGDVARARVQSKKVRELIKKCAVGDTESVYIRIPQDPGQAGKDQADSYVTALAGYIVKPVRETGDKVTRAEPFSAQWQAGNVEIYEAPWNDEFLGFMEAFPTKGVHDDDPDAAAGAFQMLVTKNSIYDDL